jgi:MoaA/NifB/PqqE/SkfB family radical SAM enzyme
LVPEQTLVKWINSVSGLRAKPRHLMAFTRHNSVKKLRNFLQLNLECRKRKYVLKALPFILAVDPTNICNLKCPLCPTGAGDYGRLKGRMKFQDFQRIIDEIGNYLYEVNLFNWGEPLLNKDIFQMAHYAHEHNISTCISTNLNVLTDGGAEALVRSRLDYLILSIDGLTQETYGKYRVGGDFDLVIENVKQIVAWKERLRSSLPFIEWQFLVFKHNQHETDKVERFAKALGVNGIFIKNSEMVSVDGPISDQSRELALKDEERKQYYEEKIGKGKSCDFLWYTIIINHDGGVSPCCLAYKEEGDFGNLFSEGHTLREIWNNTKFQAARSIFSKGNLPLEENIICNSCVITKDFIQERPKVHR